MNNKKRLDLLLVERNDLLKKDGIGPVPAWAEKSAYLKALAADGKVVITEEAKKPRKPSEDEK